MKIAIILAEVSDPTKFRARALRLVQNPELRQRIGQEAQRFYDREFDWQPIAARLLSEFGSK